jgi:hypothetical protein
VNGTRELGGAAATSVIWDSHRSSFMAVLNHPYFAKHRDSLERAKAAYALRLEELLQGLKKKRSDLAIKYGEPYEIVPRKWDRT